MTTPNAAAVLEATANTVTLKIIGRAKLVMSPGQARRLAKDLVEMAALSEGIEPEPSLFPSLDVVFCPCARIKQ